MDHDIDKSLSCRIKTCLIDKNLPADFSERLIASHKKYKRKKYIKIIGCSLILLSLLSACFLIPTKYEEATSKECYISAAPERPVETVTGLMMLGFFRDCIHRLRTNRKKGENNDY